MKQPVIGIVPALDEATKLPDSLSTHYLRRTYTEVLNQVGAVPLILNIDMPIDSVVDLCDGVVISGGEDIDPATYGEELLKLPGKLLEPPARFAWERQLIDACDQAKLPILGICYGMQLLNVHYGGTLYQDIPLQVPESISHQLTMHDIEFTEDFLGYTTGIVGNTASRHHQAVRDLAPGFTVCGLAPDGIVEAIRGHGHFGMQWHPESDATGVRVYRSFVEHCLAGDSAPHSTPDMALFA